MVPLERLVRVFLFAFHSNYAVSTRYTNVTDTQPADTARQQEPRYAAALDCSRAVKTEINKLTKKKLKQKKTRRWHVTISCQPDGRPSQPVRRWKSGRVHLAEGSNVVVLELPYSTEFGRESRKLASGVRKYGKFDDGR